MTDAQRTVTSSPDPPQHQADPAALARLDLNLLVTLDALLAERSVTRAAERLHLSQPAVSGSLARLRAHFNDDILTRRGNTYELTPLAARLSEMSSVVLDGARRIFDVQEGWRPAVSTREYSIYGSDQTFTVLAPLITRLAAEEAPSVTFRFIRFTPQLVGDIVSTLRSVDAVVMPHTFLGDLEYMDLWQESWVMLAADSNEAVRDGVRPEHVFELPWVVTPLSRRAIPAATLHSQSTGMYPRIEVRVESSLALPWLVAGTDRLAIVQSSLAAYCAVVPGVRLFHPPFDAAPITNALWWHPAHTQNPEHIWMRGVFDRAGRMLEGK